MEYEVRLSMDNKKIVITGASRGIGLEMARILIEKGHTVFGAVRNPDGASAVSYTHLTLPTKA